MDSMKNKTIGKKDLNIKLLFFQSTLYAVVISPLQLNSMPIMLKIVHFIYYILLTYQLDNLNPKLLL